MYRGEISNNIISNPVYMNIHWSCFDTIKINFALRIFKAFFSFLFFGCFIAILEIHKINSIKMIDEHRVAIITLAARGAPKSKA